MDINKILGFTFNPDKFEGFAKRAFDGAVVSRNVEKLRATARKLDEYSDGAYEVELGKVVKYLRRCCREEMDINMVNISEPERRALSYNLSVTWPYQMLDYCIRVLERDWRYSFLRGLLHSYMTQWGEGEPDNTSLLLHAISFHTDNDISKSANNLREVKDIIENPYLLGRRLKKDGKDILSACEVFCLPENRISYPYFSDAIVFYYADARPLEMTHMFSTLKIHNNQRTDKTVLPHWIISFSENGKIPQELLEFAIKRIGDPFKKETWAPFIFATTEEQANLERARIILANQLSARIINVFFKNLCQDTERRKFWLKYTDKVSNFSVYGTESSKQALAGTVNKDMLNSHFNIISNNTATCALCMEMGHYLIIEFTDTGALYAYKKGGDEYKRVFHKKIERLEELKLTRLNNLVELGYNEKYNSEGRMVHTGYWQTRLSKWISRKIK